jgi:hypothetical protein
MFKIQVTENISIMQRIHKNKTSLFSKRTKITEELSCTVDLIHFPIKESCMQFKLHKSSLLPLRYSRHFYKGKKVILKVLTYWSSLSLSYHPYTEVLVNHFLLLYSWGKRVEICRSTIISE